MLTQRVIEEEAISKIRSIFKDYRKNPRYLSCRIAVSYSERDHIRSSSTSNLRPDPPPKTKPIHVYRHPLPHKITPPSRHEIGTQVIIENEHSVMDSSNAVPETHQRELTDNSSQTTLTVAYIEGMILNDFGNVNIVDPDNPQRRFKKVIMIVPASCDDDSDEGMETSHPDDIQPLCTPEQITPESESSPKRNVIYKDISYSSDSETDEDKPGPSSTTIHKRVTFQLLGNDTDSSSTS